jgi:hypothetical protein
MKAVVIYESMYGNTHLIADAIAEGFRAHGEAEVVPVGAAEPELVGQADVVIVGGPTHAHGMSHAATRKGAAEAAAKPDSELVLEPDAENDGLREWFESLGDVLSNAAAFDTRFDMPAAITGRASKGIAKKLRHHGAHVVCEPKSFFVKKDNHLEPNEKQRAREWGAQLGVILEGVAARTTGMSPT